MAHDSEQDRREDRSYREGYMQAWRQWSACVKPDGVSPADRRRLEKAREAVARRTDQ
jgi:hypothetical protein